jgi:hypothetical protein
MKKKKKSKVAKRKKVTNISRNRSVKKKRRKGLDLHCSKVGRRF